MSHVADWILVNFSKLAIFKFAQSVEFKGGDIAEPQGFERS
jgi:hypothetical protein